MFTVSAVIAIVISVLVYANPRIRNLEDEIPDALPSSTE
jgi:hypothetical protein